MSHQYFIDKDVNCVFVRFEGEVDFDEMRKIMAMISDSPDHTSGMCLLRDLSAATLQIEGDFESIKGVIAARDNQVRNKLGKNRLVAWVLNNAKDYGIIHRMTALSRLDHFQITRRPFRDIAKAREFLGIPVDYEIKYLSADETA